MRGLGAELTDYTGKNVAIVNALDSYGAEVERNGITPHGASGSRVSRRAVRNF